MDINLPHFVSSHLFFVSLLFTLAIGLLLSMLRNRLHAAILLGWTSGAGLYYLLYNLVNLSVYGWTFNIAVIAVLIVCFSILFYIRPLYSLKKRAVPKEATAEEMQQYQDRQSN